MYRCLMVKHVVKRKGHEQHYDEKKVYASVYAAAVNCHYNEQHAEKLARFVMVKVNQWVQDRSIVTSQEIKEQILHHLKIEDHEVRLMYESHLDLC